MTATMHPHRVARMPVAGTPVAGISVAGTPVASMRLTGTPVDFVAANKNARAQHAAAAL
jgi:hypothetical protein